MKRREPVTFKVTIDTRGNMDLVALLDMLRYEGARVTNWNRVENGFDVFIASDNFTFERWRSFGITPRLS